MALQLLLPRHIVPAFRQLQQLQQQDGADAAIADLCSYVESTWLLNDEVTSDAVYQQDMHTNDLEGWHHRLNNVARCTNIQLFYMLVRLLYGEATAVTLQLQLISDDRTLCRTSRKYEVFNNRFKNLWAAYAAGQCNTMSYDIWLPRYRTLDESAINIAISCNRYDH